MIGIIRVLTIDDPEILQAHGRLLEKEYALPTLSRCIPDQPRGIYDEATEALARPKIIALAQQMAAEGCRAILISCAADPALNEVRAEVPVPVVGAGSAGAAVALALGGRVGVLSITPDVPAPIARVLGDRVVAVARPQGVTNTTHLLEPGARDRAVEAARGLVQQGADVILFGCTGFVTVGVAPRIRAELGVPVVDPVLAAGLILRYATDTNPAVPRDPLNPQRSVR